MNEALERKTAAGSRRSRWGGKGVPKKCGLGGGGARDGRGSGAGGGAHLQYQGRWEQKVPASERPRGGAAWGDREMCNFFLDCFHFLSALGSCE